MVPLEYRIPDNVLRYYRMRYNRDPQVGDLIPGPKGQPLEICSIRESKSDE